MPSLPKPTQGIDNVSSETQLPENAVRVARNVDISREGVVSTRPGARRIIDLPNARDLYSGPRGAFCAAGTTVYRIDVHSEQAQAVGLVGGGRVDYCEIPQGTVVTSSYGTGLIEPDGLMVSLAPETPRAPAVAATTGTGELYAGQYGIAVAYKIGDREGALSAAGYASLNEPGSIKVSVPEPGSDEVTGANIYRTTANGDTYYLAASVIGGDMTLTSQAVGRAAHGRFMSVIGAGSICRHWNGRLLVASGNTLMIGESMRHGLFSPRFGFIQRPRPITLVAPTDGALFVGTDADTVVYTGRSPENLSMTMVDAGIAAPWSDVQAPLDAFSGEWATNSAMCSCWLTGAGYVVGLPDGAIISPQKMRYRTSGRMVGKRTALHNRRLFTA